MSYKHNRGINVAKGTVDGWQTAQNCAVFFREYATRELKTRQNIEALWPHKASFMNFTALRASEVHGSLYTKQTQRPLIHIRIDQRQFGRGTCGVCRSMRQLFVRTSIIKITYGFNLPRRRSLTSLAALSPSALRFLSIILLLSTAALSSALSVQPMLILWKSSKIQPSLANARPFRVNFHSPANVYSTEGSPVIAIRFSGLFFPKKHVLKCLKTSPWTFLSGFPRKYGARLRFYRNNQPEPRPHTEQTMRDTDAGNEKSRILSWRYCTSNIPVLLHW